MTDLNGANVLVAGGTGFIGTNLVLRLLAEGANVRSTRHLSDPKIDEPDVEYIQGDLTIMEDCKTAVDGMDYVFMCAANTSGAAVMTSTPLAHVTPNVVMNAQLMDASYDAEIKKFVFISSSAAYPPTGDRPTREDEMMDGDPYDTYYSVGWMKRYAEILCLVYSKKLRNPMPTVVIRPSNVYGPYDDFDFATSHMQSALMRRVVERHSPLEVWGTGDDVRDLIYIDDFIDGMMLAFEKSSDYMAVNIASGKGHSVKEILSMILTVDGYDNADVIFDPTKPTTIPIRLVDTSYAKSALGFEAKSDLSQGLKTTLDWYRGTLVA
jgi:GDP-L-fucose synthase